MVLSSGGDDVGGVVVVAVAAAAAAAVVVVLVVLVVVVVVVDGHPTSDNERVSGASCTFASAFSGQAPIVWESESPLLVVLKMSRDRLGAAVSMVSP